MSKSKNSRASKEDLQVNRARDRRPSIDSGHACMHAAAAQAAVALVSSNHGGTRGGGRWRLDVKERFRIELSRYRRS